MPIRLLALFGAVVLFGCRHTKLHEYTGIGIGPPVVAGMTSAAIARAAGGCFAQCSPGYGCDEGSGLCEKLVETNVSMEVLFAQDAGTR